jgi:small-conductance mechanosensitive channel
MLSLLLLSCCNLALAQQPQSAAAPTKAGPEVIDSAEIPTRADIDERFAQQLVERTRRANPTSQFEPRLDALSKSIQEQSLLFKDDELSFLPVFRLESLDRHWRFFGKQFDHWRADLKRVTDPYAADAAEAGKRRANWEATGAAAVTTSLAPALVDRISSVRSQLALAEQAVSGPLEKQIRLGRRGNALEGEIQAGQQAVTAAIAYNDSRLGRIDAAPIWAMERQSKDVHALDGLKTGLAIETSFALAYGSANQLTKRVQNWLWLALLPVLIWTSYRTRRQVFTDPQLQAASRVLRRPFSSWLVLLTTSILVVESDAPMILHQLALVLALVPVLRTLPPRVYTTLGAWPALTAGLYLLDQLSFLLLGNLTFYRIYLLFVTSLSLLLTTWMLWRSHRRNAVGGAHPARTIIRYVARTSMAILGVAALSNIFGNVSLAEMLTRALLSSAALGLMLYAVVTLLESLLQLLVANPALSQVQIVLRHGSRLLRGFARLARLAAFAGWLLFAMNEFRIFRPTYDALSRLLSIPLSFGQISLTLGNIAMFVFSVFVAIWIAKTIRIILQDEVLTKMSLPRGVANSISTLSYYALVLLGLLVSLAAAGFQIGQLAILIGALGVGIGLGLQHVVNNFVSGLILMFERPIQPGDIVEITGTSGTVREIGMRATTLTTFDGADVVVPNGTLLSEKLTNWTLSNMSRRIEMDIGVGCATDPRQALALLLKVTQETPGIAAKPEPTIVFNGFGTSSLDFGIRAWTHQLGSWVETRSNLGLRLHEALMAAGIEIPLPQRELHLRSISPQVAAQLVRPPEAPMT